MGYNYCFLVIFKKCYSNGANLQIFDRVKIDVHYLARNLNNEQYITGIIMRLYFIIRLEIIHYDLIEK